MLTLLSVSCSNLYIIPFLNPDSLFHWLLKFCAFFQWPFLVPPENYGIFYFYCLCHILSVYTWLSRNFRVLELKVWTTMFGHLQCFNWAFNSHLSLVSIAFSFIPSPGETPAVWNLPYSISKDVFWFPYYYMSWCASPPFLCPLPSSSGSFESCLSSLSTFVLLFSVFLLLLLLWVLLMLFRDCLWTMRHWSRCAVFKKTDRWGTGTKYRPHSSNNFSLKKQPFQGMIKQRLKSYLMWDYLWVL